MVFLLDQLPDNCGFSVDELVGTVVGVHVGGLDEDNNIAFKLNLGQN